jgi:hypothetical protein
MLASQSTFCSSTSWSEIEAEDGESENDDLIFGRVLSIESVKDDDSSSLSLSVINKPINNELQQPTNLDQLETTTTTNKYHICTCSMCRQFDDEYYYYQVSHQNDDNVVDEHTFRKNIQRKQYKADGKTLRSLCRCRESLPCLEKTNQQPTWSSDGTKSYVVDQMDISHPEMSNKTSFGNMEELHAALSSVAIGKIELTSNQQRRNLRDRKMLSCTIYNVPIVGEIRVPVSATGSTTIEQQPHSNMIINDEKLGKNTSHPWYKKYVPQTYYKMYDFTPLQSLRDGKQPYELVTSYFTVPTTDDHFVSSSSSKDGIPQPIDGYSHQSYYGSSKNGSRYHHNNNKQPMYSRESVIQELQRCTNSGGYVHSTLHSMGFIAETTPHDNYSQWYLQFDFKHEATKVSHLLIVGRAPEIEGFPAWKTRHDDGIPWHKWRKFPQFPCIVANDSPQFVRRVEVSARSLGGKWFIVGIFNANEDALGEVMITIPNDGITCRYLRVRPLSRAQGGFEGKAPAMRVVPYGYLTAPATTSSSKSSATTGVTANNNQDISINAMEGCIQYFVYDSPTVEKPCGRLLYENGSRKHVYGPWAKSWADCHHRGSLCWCCCRSSGGAWLSTREKVKRDLIDSHLANGRWKEPISVILDNDGDDESDVMI